jgi:hypothetical protein
MRKSKHSSNRWSDAPTGEHSRARASATPARWLEVPTAEPCRQGSAGTTGHSGTTRSAGQRMALEMNHAGLGMSRQADETGPGGQQPCPDETF